jgi:hypothetical protein
MDARLIAALALGVGLSFPCHAFEHAAWDALLKKHVVVVDEGKSSRVRYAGMAQDRPALQGYLAALSAVQPAEFDAWPREAQVAFLINAYNAFTVEKVLTRYPNLRSIRDFGRVFGNPFRDEFFSLLGARRSLDWIEHETLRKRYADARLHYALNCASVGCPMLREEAYAARQLQAQLDEQARRFLSDRSRNRLRGDRLEVSRIFDWFSEDFEPRARYFARHAPVLGDDARARTAIAAGQYELHFLDYDWSLNDFPSSSPR